LQKSHEPVVEALGAIDVQFEVFRLGDAGIGIHHLGFPFLDGGLHAVGLHFEGLPGGGELFRFCCGIVRAAFGPFDLRIELDDFGMFGPQVFAEFLALDLQQFNLLEGRLALDRGRRRAEFCRARESSRDPAKFVVPAPFMSCSSAVASIS
jgi:hypothetical protein